MEWISQQIKRPGLIQFNLIDREREREREGGENIDIILIVTDWSPVDQVPVLPEQ